MGLLFQGGVEFPTGGVSVGRMGRPGAGRVPRAQPMSPRTRQALGRLRADPVKTRGQRSESGWKRQVILVTEQSSHIHFENTNRWGTRQLVTMALLCAASALLMFLQIPIIPGVTFLSYDPSLVPAMVAGLMFGPGSGVAVGVVAIAIRALTTGEWVGALMNVVATVSFILPAAWAARRTSSPAGTAAGLAAGCALATLASIAANLTIGVWFWYGSPDAIVPLILPAILPFNIVKTVLNAVLSVVVFRAVRPLVDASRGR